MTEPAGDPSDERPSRYARPVNPAAARGPSAEPVRPPTAGRSAPTATSVAQPRRRRKPAGRRLRAFAAIVRVAGPPAALALVATLIFVVAVETVRRTEALAVNAWLLSIGALVLWTAWRVLAAALPATTDTAFDSVRSRPVEKPLTLPEVILIEGVLIDAEWSWRGVEYRLRPLLRRLAAARLAERHQVDLEADPTAARRILGPELWALVGPGAYGPTSTPTPDSTTTKSTRTGNGAGDGSATESAETGHRRGIPRATIRRAIDLLEAL